MSRLLGRTVAVLCLALSIPVHAQDAPPPLSSYGSLPAVEDMAISPSGDTMAIVTTIAGERRLLVLDRELAIKKQIAAGSMKFRDLEFIGDEALLYSYSQTANLYGFTADQAEISQSMVVQLVEGGEPYQVFLASDRLVNGIFGYYGIRQTAEGWRGYFGAIEKERTPGMGIYEVAHGRPSLFEVDFANRTQRRISDAADDDSQYRDWLVGDDGNVAATLDFSRTTGSWTIRNARRLSIAEGRNLNGAVSILGLGTDGTTVIYSTEDTAESEMRWFEVPLAGGESRPFLQGVSVDRLLWHRDSARVLGYYPDGADTPPVLFDTEMQGRARLLQRSFQARNGEMLEWTSDLGQAIVHTSGTGDSGTWIFVDLANRAAEEVGYDRPGIRAAAVGPVSLVEYTAGDGLALDGVLTLPPGREATGLPLIVLPHGGPQGHDEPQFDWWAQAFAARGYAVFQPNFRGSTNRDEAFVRAGFGQWGRLMQTDISDGVAHLAAQGTIDPARACIVGASYGGYAALAGVTVQQGLYRCAVAVAGVSDIGAMYSTETYQSGRRHTVRVSLLEELGPRDTWAAVSPRRLAARADAPILLIHGRDDTVVLFEQSAVMADALEDAGKPHQLIELAGEDHWLSNAETRQQMLQATMDFVTWHNPAD